MRFPPGCLALLLVFWLAVVLPIFLADAFVTALAKLGLSPAASLVVLVGIFFGGAINLPIQRIPRDEVVQVAPVGLFGFDRLAPQWVRTRRYTVIAVNVGGCIIPCAIAGYELLRVAGHGPGMLAAALVAVGINVVLCYWVARPVPRMGIALPPLVPAAAGAACGLLLAPGFAPPVAFVAGVLGPLIGADLLRLDDVRRKMTGVASIGGAGTFDAIVISGFVATLLV
jgi:uncharacterized membrane protein